MSEETKAVVRRFAEEFIGQRNRGIATKLFAPDFTDHTAGPETDPGVTGLVQFFGIIERGFPDFTVTVEDLFAEGDKVAMRFTFQGTHKGEFMGIPPTGRWVTMPGIDIFRIADGKIVELWGQEDMLGMMQQLGVLPGSEDSAS